MQARIRSATGSGSGDGGSPKIAVSAASNRSKSHQGPGTWLPPYETYRCQYVDQAEQAALAEILGRCPNEPITVTLAR